jgi:hypothetical protein
LTFSSCWRNLVETTEIITLKGYKQNGVPRKGVLLLFLNVRAWIERPQGPQEFDTYATFFRIEPPYNALASKDKSAWLPGEIGREEESKIDSNTLSEDAPMRSEDEGSSLGDVMSNRFDLPSLVGSCDGCFEKRNYSRVLPPFKRTIHSPPLDWDPRDCLAQSGAIFAKS